MTTAPEWAYTVYSHLSEDDLYAQLLKSNLRPATGQDGIAFFVYRQFQDVLFPYMTTIYNACSQYRRVPAWCTENVTVLIPKGGDPNDAKSWQCINLQNCAYTNSKQYSTQARFPTGQSRWQSPPRRRRVSCQQMDAMSISFFPKLFSILLVSRRRRCP